MRQIRMEQRDEDLQAMDPELAAALPSPTDDHSLTQQFRQVYEELRRMAAVRLRQEPSGITLQPTALVHEVYLRMVQTSTELDWKSPAHFLAIAAEVMRHILVDNARRKARIKRGGEWRRTSTELEQVGKELDQQLLLDLNDALEDLAKVDAHKARLVVLRYFGGLTVEEVCEVLGISRVTAHRYWLYSKAWLYQRLGDSFRLNSN